VEAVERLLDRQRLVAQQRGGPDTLVAGTCLERGCPILTRNVRHFARVPGLAVLEPG
jgi:predicted nucleic acid-binding protein